MGQAQRALRWRMQWRRLDVPSGFAASFKQKLLPAQLPWYQLPCNQINKAAAPPHAMR
jgi:hypothetical protein